MDLKQLHYFTEIVKHGNISKAAEGLHMAQPPLSQALKKLELELETTLIERYRTKWSITETGQYVFEQAEALKSRMGIMRRTVKEIELGEAGTLSIGLSTACAQLCVGSLKKFKQQYPNVFLNIQQGSSHQMEEKLRENDIECAMMLKPLYDHDYEMRTLSREIFVALFPENWSLLENHVSLAELHTMPLIVLGRMEGYSMYENVLNAFYEKGLKPNIEIECHDIGLVQSLVKKEMGIGVVPLMGVQQTPGIQIVPIDDLHLIFEPVVLHRKERELSPKAQHFLTILLEDLVEGEQ